MFGKEATEEMEFTELTPPTGFLLEAHSHGMHYLTRHTLEEIEGGTRLTLSFEGRPETFGARIMGPIMGLLFGGAMKKAVLSDMDAIKASLETEAAA